MKNDSARTMTRNLGSALVSVLCLAFAFNLLTPVSSLAEKNPPSIHFFMIGDSLVADSVIQLDDVDFSVERLPFSTMFSSRQVESLTRAEFSGMVAGSAEELLATVPGIDLRSRGGQGVQADLAMRGGTFEQTLVLLDGVRINDPQTGHHNMDIPVSVDDLERVEVLRGPGSTLYGPGAFSGVVNFITRRGGPSRIDVSAAGGEHGLYEYAGAGSFNTGLISHRLSAGTVASDGFTDNTDFETINALYTARAAGHVGTIDLTTGWTQTDFGANSFYMADPMEREITEAMFGSLSMRKTWKRAAFELNLHGRRHFDEYEGDYALPDGSLYPIHNKHRSDTYGTRASVMFASVAGLSTVGMDISQEELRSSNMGDIDRALGGILIEQTFPQFFGLSSTVTGNLYHHGDYGWHAWPGLSISHELGAGFRASGSADYSFRTPSYTELYYRDPNFESDMELDPERAILWEAGISYHTGILRANTTVYQRYGRDLIDWVRESPDAAWQVMNHTEMTTSGVELDLTWQLSDVPVLETIRTGVSRIENDRELNGLESRYAMTYLRTQGTLQLGLLMPGQVNLWLTGRYNDRMEYDDYFTLDARIARTFGAVDVYVQGSNLTDTDYEQYVGVPTPGRWVKAGIKTGIELK